MAEITFKQRVDKFWAWFTKHADRFYQTIEDGKCPDLGTEFQEACGSLLPGFAWNFGPGENGGHSFTLSGEGDLNRQILTSFWLSRAPQLNGWTFYSAKQATESLEGKRIDVADMSFSPEELIFVPRIDREEEKINLQLWHPNFKQSDDELKYTLAFLWLDESLGETGVQNWIGEITFKKPGLFSKGKPLTELAGYVNQLQAQEDWEKFPPDQTYSTYSMPEPSEAFPRADTIAGSTCNMRLIGEFLSTAGEMESPGKEVGADFAYLAIDPSVFPDGKQVEVRGEIEDTLNSTLESKASGRVFGGAFGFRAAYVDIVLFDGEESLKLVHGVMQYHNLHDKYEVCSFGS